VRNGLRKLEEERLRMQSAAPAKEGAPAGEANSGTQA
jgi:hypothetical protein